MKEANHKNFTTPESGAHVFAHLYKRMEKSKLEECEYLGKAMTSKEGYRHLVKSKEGTIHVLDGDSSIRPLPPKVELIDGKAYQFEYFGAKQGFYKKATGMFIFLQGHAKSDCCTNIVPLVPEVNNND